MGTIGNIASLAVPSRELEVDYPGIDGFKVRVAFQSRDELMKMRKKATTQKFKNRQLEEVVDDQLFLQLYVRAVIKGWTGLKYKDLSRLMLVDISGIDAEAEIPYSPEDALELMKGSSEFDGFITETISDISNFSKSSSQTSKD